MNHENLRCMWRNYDPYETIFCDDQATTCVICGCLNGHIEEIVICHYHLNVWVDAIADRGAVCTLNDCGLVVDSWEKTPISTLSAGFALHMKTRQAP